MGVDTKGKVDKKYNPIDIHRALKQKFSIDGQFERTSWADYTVVCFTYKDEQRQLHIHTNTTDTDTGTVATTMSFGHWGSSVELMKGVVSCFGGYIKEADTRDDWAYVAAGDPLVLSEEEQRQDKLLWKISESELDHTTKMKIVEYVNANLDFIKSL